LLDEFSYLHGLVIGKVDNINPAGQIADVNGGILHGDFLLQELLTIKIHYGNVTLEEWLLFS